MSSPAPVKIDLGMRTTIHPLRYQQIAMVVLLFGGYACYYFCRSDLSVAMPLLIEELHSHGMSGNDAVIRLGAISSFGVLAYAVGKLFLTTLGDIWGGRRSFIIGLGGAIAFTLLFASGGSLPIFTIAWIGNRLIQSIGWGGLVKVCSRWFSYSSYGTIVGVLSLSFLIGDAAARQWMGMLIHKGYGWQFLFYFAAGVAGLLFIANMLFLRESRAELGYPEPKANPLNLFADRAETPKNLKELLKALLLSRAFAVVCFLSLGCTIVRETFNIWTPVYLLNAFGFSPSNAASTSAIFPGVGAVSVLLSGWISDRIGARGRSVVMFVGLTATGLGLVALTSLRTSAKPSLLPVLLIGFVALCLLGPYSYLAGAFALDFGGTQAGSTSSGVIDAAGYLGGAVAGGGVARISVAIGWPGVFVVLTVVTALSALAAGYLCIHQHRIQRNKG